MTLIADERVQDQAARYYNRIAADYDGFFATPEADAENQTLADLLGYHSGTVLDIGCGTGLFLEYVNIRPANYLGVDPSEGMIRRLEARHPLATTLCATFESFLAANGDAEFDHVVSWFGSPNYIEAAALARVPSLLAPGGRYQIVLYKSDYYPATYVAAGEGIPHFNHPKDVIPGSDVLEMGNFNILMGGV